jgi:hypothetical protein
MNSAEEFIANRKVGRKKGGKCSNRVREVYWALKKDKKVSVDYHTFGIVLRTVADVFWKKIYAGYSVAIPYLLNMEIVPNKILFARSVDWNRTFTWWKEDNDAFEERLLVRNQPTLYFLRARHSTFSRIRRMWYYPLLFDIRPMKQRVRDVETKYELR